ncbi:putative ribonuclease H-like domain-containing protein [Tanacetum coccineum]
MSNKSETDSEISMSVFEVRSSDEEITPTYDRFSKADGYHVIPPPIIGNFLTPRADISFACLDEYAIRKKIIESKTDTSKPKTSETIGVLTMSGLVNPVRTNRKKTVHTISTAKPINTPRPISTIRPVSTARPFAPKNSTNWTRVVVNVDADTKEHYVAGSLKKDKEPTKEYILLLLHPYRPRISVEEVVPAAQEKPSKSSPKDNDVHDSEDATSINKLNTGRPSVSTSNSPLVSTTNTPYGSVASTPTGVNTVGSSFVYLGRQIPIDTSTLPTADLHIDLNMLDLEDGSNVFPNDGIFSGAYDDEDVGAEANFNNMDNTIDVSLIPTLKVHKDHPKGQILGDPKLAFQIRGKIQKASSVQQALKMKAGLKQCMKNCSSSNYKSFWILVDLPFRKKAIGTKWVFRNKRDERRLRQSEEVYVHQPLGFIDPAHPNNVYMVIKALYGLHQALRAWYETLTSFLVKQKPNEIFISQDKYVADILKKFNFCSIKPATTPIESNKPQVKDEDGVDVDVHVYRSMIGSLAYLTASRLDIMFAIYVYARFQVTPKASHINAVKRIFRDCYKKRLIDVIKIHTDANVIDLLTKGFDVTRFKFLVENLVLQDKFGAARKKFMLFVTVTTIVSMANLEFVDQHNMVTCLAKTEGKSNFHKIVDFLASSSIHHTLTIDATVDSKAVVVTEASIRSCILFNDTDGTACLTNEAIF